ncbi:hypothetical protein [Mycolicibacterium sp. CR10]|uniref:hypothetical protein n=1 Tax=Mycolicibacterium sp. CR10 TaxID=2562314 RepID=UPI0010C144A7|nr:hypothetical protein [Mycolicibacterium sp. CR10]
MAYRLDVVTAGVAEAVRRAGGLMFDRALAGWKVRVVTDDRAHGRALRILGARAEPPAHLADAQSQPDRVVRTLLLPVDQFTGNRRSLVAGSMKTEPPAELLLWGRHVDSELTSLLHPVRYGISSAARRFKEEALRCADLDGLVEPWEEFWASNILDQTPFGHFRLAEQRLKDAESWNAVVARTHAPPAKVVGGSPHG